MPHHFLVTGRVQGVGFRNFVKQAAEALGVRGWVRNRDDGAVEAVAEGDLDAFEARLREGPAAAEVDSVTRTPSTAGIGRGFAVRQ